MIKMTKEEFEEAYSLHLDWYSNREEGKRMAISDRDLRHLDLRGKVFSCAELTHCTFEGAILDRANFNHAKLCGSSLHRARLEGARCVDVDFSGADCSFVDFRGVDLGRSKLMDVCLYGCIGNGLEIKSFQVIAGVNIFYTRYQLYFLDLAVDIEWLKGLNDYHPHELLYHTERYDITERTIALWKKWRPFLKYAVEFSPAVDLRVIGEQVK